MGVLDLLHGIVTGAYTLETLIQWGGYLVLFVIVFTETGLLVGFFLPGDSLLITAGARARLGGPENLWRQPLGIGAGQPRARHGHALAARPGLRRLLPAAVAP